VAARVETSLDAAVADLAERFRAALEPPARAGTSVTPADLRARLEEPLPEHGIAVDELLAELAAKVEPGLAGTTGGRYFGYVTGGLLPGAAIAQAWAGALDQNPGLWTLAPAGVELDRVVVGWLFDLLDLPRGSGAITTGATMANTVCLAVARHALGTRHGIDLKTDGLQALPPFAVYGSEELHFSDVKALRTLGIGSAQVRSVPIDERYRLRADLLREVVAADRATGIEPAVVIAQVGSVNTGASDPLEEIADICVDESLWLHVDGAFGSFFRLCDRTAPLAAGLERADSITVDGHKWLNLPNGIGFALLRDPAVHVDAFSAAAPAYLTQDADVGLDEHRLGIEASRNWRGPAIWAALKELGRSGVRELVTRCCDLTQELVALVESSPRLELTAPAPTCVVCFRYRPDGWSDGPELDELNRAIQREVAAAGDVFATGALLRNGFCQRACIVSWRTTSEDVAALAEAVEEAGGRLAG
jgi:glutamate/tyrosine decarboxylase-like PLP-dependent enzyme